PESYAARSETQATGTLSPLGWLPERLGRWRFGPATAERPEAREPLVDAQQPAPARATDQRLRFVVEGGIVHQLAEGPLAAVELLRDVLEIPDRSVEVAEDASGVGLVLDQLADGAATAIQPVAHLFARLGVLVDSCEQHIHHARC